MPQIVISGIGGREIQQKCDIQIIDRGKIGPNKIKVLRSERKDDKNENTHIERESKT